MYLIMDFRNRENHINCDKRVVMKVWNVDESQVFVQVNIIYTEIHYSRFLHTCFSSYTLFETYHKFLYLTDSSV